MRVNPISMCAFCVLGLFFWQGIGVVVFGGETDTNAGGEVWGEIGRIVSWNIELVGTRNPRRTEEQLLAVADRMIEFDASLFVLQEIYDLEVMGEIASYFPDSWRVTNAGKEHVFFYDTNEIELLSWETLSHLSKEPYTEYPGKDSSKPMMGMFRWAGIYSEPFCVISIHCKANDKTMQRAEGKWLLARVIELLDSGDVGREITVIGDTNGEPDNVPSTELVEGGVLYRLDNVNGEETDTRGRRVDHCYVTEDSYARIKDEKATVFGPAYYGETRTEFRDTYSDHYPLLVDVECVQGGRLELFARFAHEWGSVECGVENGWCRGGDINADGEVGLEDLRMLFSQWVAGTP